MNNDEDETRELRKLQSEGTAAKLAPLRLQERQSLGSLFANNQHTREKETQTDSRRPNTALALPLCPFASAPLSLHSLGLGQRRAEIWSEQCWPTAARRPNGGAGLFIVVPPGRRSHSGSFSLRELALRRLDFGVFSLQFSALSSQLVACSLQFAACQHRWATWSLLADELIACVAD